MGRYPNGDVGMAFAFRHVEPREAADLRFLWARANAIQPASRLALIIETEDRRITEVEGKLRRPMAHWIE